MLKRSACAVFAMLMIVSIACVPEVPSTPPSGTIAVNGGASAVNTLNVTLLFSRSAKVPQMRVADGPDPEGNSWRDFADSISWDLPDIGQGERVISAQFRDEAGVESEVVTTTIVYDTVPPSIAVTDPVPGSVVDVSNGELALASGDVMDESSEVASLQVEAPDGSAVPATVDGTTWATPISAPESGLFTYKFSAADAAGNVATIPVQFDIKAMPPATGTVVRPTTWELDTAQRSSVVRVDSDSVEINGDYRAAAQGKFVMIAAPLPAVAPDGLLLSIDAVTFDAETGRTRIQTTPGNLADAFAQFEIATPEVSEQAVPNRSEYPSSVADSCGGFGDDKFLRMSIGKQFAFNKDGAKKSYAELGSFLRADVSLVAFLDLNLRMTNSFLPGVGGNISVGAMACGEIGLQGSGKFGRDLEMGSVRVPAGNILGIPVTAHITSGTRINADATLLEVSASVRAGIQADWEIGKNAPSVSIPRDVDGSLMPAFGGGTASVMPYFDISLEVATVSIVDLFDMAAGLEFGYNHATRTASTCAKVEARFKPQFRIKIPVINKEITILDSKWEPATLTGPCDTRVFGSDDPPPPPPVSGALTGNIAREPNGHSWYVDKRNWKHWIPNGGTFECLIAQGRKVVAADWERDLEHLPDDGKLAECVRANTGDILRTDDGDSYLLEPDFSRRWIADGRTYECLVASDHAVVDSVPRYHIEDLPKGDDYSWSCWNAGNAKGKVVRAGDGSSWYIDLRGGRHWIPNGGTYQCIVAEGRPDYGNKVPRAWIDSSFTKYEDAKCVRAGSGSIVKTDDGDSHLMDSSTSRRPIDDGATYLCLASEGRSVVSGVPRYFIEDLRKNASIGGQTCIVRGPGGDAHFINNAGKKEWIPDTPTYDCEVGRGVPVRNVSQGFLNGISSTGWHYCLNPASMRGKILSHTDSDSSYIHPNDTRTWIPDKPTYDCRIRQGKAVVETRWREYVNHFDNTGWDYCYDINTLKEKIVTHTDGDHHYVRGDGRRMWIPNNTVYNCLKAKGIPETTVRWRQYIENMPEFPGWAEC